MSSLAVLPVSTSTSSTLVKLLLGGWLVLSMSAAEMFIVETLAQAKPTQGIKYSQEGLQSSTLREFDYRATPDTRSSLPNPILGKYLVFVNQDSPLMLQLVKQIEPTAFMRQYKENSVIQAGIFQDKDNAEELETKLESQGVEAQILKLDQSKLYFVVIPAQGKDVPRIKDRVTRLGMNAKAVVSNRDKKRGSYVRVGPFVQREQAEQWKNHILASGLENALVYYGR